MYKEFIFEIYSLVKLAIKFSIYHVLNRYTIFYSACSKLVAVTQNACTKISCITI